MEINIWLQMTTCLQNTRITAYVSAGTCLSGPTMELQNVGPQGRWFSHAVDHYFFKAVAKSLRYFYLH